MHPSLRVAAAALACGVVVAGLAATPALAATVPPAPASTSTTVEPAGKATATVAAPVVKTITTTGRGRFSLEVDAQKGAELTVRDARGKQVGHTAVAGDPALVGVVWDTQDAPSQRRFTVMQTVDGVTSSATPFRLGDAISPDPDRLAMPEIDGAAIDGALARIRVGSATAPDGSRAEVTDFYGKVLASQPLLGGKAEVTLMAPTSTERYLVRVAAPVGGSAKTSLPVDVTLSVGNSPLVPDAPSIDAVSTVGSHEVATVAGTPGAIVTVRDSLNRVVAIKKLAGSARTAQIVVPDVEGLNVTQATGAIESDPTAIELP